MKENLDLRGGRKWTEEADRKTQAGKPLARDFRRKVSLSLGGGVKEGTGKEGLFFKWPIFVIT